VRDAPLSSRFCPAAAVPHLRSRERGTEGARLFRGEVRVRRVAVTRPEDGGDGGGCENPSASGR